MERLLLRYSDGTNEWRDPPTVPNLGAVVRHAGQQWIVAAIENESDVTIAILRRAPKTAHPTDAQPDVA